MFSWSRLILIFCAGFNWVSGSDTSPSAKISKTDTLLITQGKEGYQATLIQKKPDVRLKKAKTTIKTSLSASAQKAGLSSKVIMELATLFGWDIDFALDVRKGDSFKVLYEEKFIEGKKIDDGDIIAAKFTNQGKTYEAVRFIDKKGNKSYYTPDGLNIKKEFMRTPVANSRISSGFDLNRKHPVLHQIRAHKGVDYAAPTGTPIKATGDGKVIFIGRKGGYGKAIIIQHGHAISTLYGHLSTFSTNTKLGSKVKQGQVIGYVGATGLATGPHLHYEFRVHGVHRNPVTVKLPKGQPIAVQYKKEFTTQAKRLMAEL